MKIRKRLAVGGICAQCFESLKIEQAAVKIVCARLGNDVDDASGRATKLSAGSGRDDLKLFDGFKSDIDSGSLAARLLAKEPVVVVPAVKTDVVEDAALSGEADLIAVGSLHDADARRERQQIFKLASENWQVADRQLVER